VAAFDQCSLQPLVDQYLVAGGGALGFGEFDLHFLFAYCGGELQLLHPGKVGWYWLEVKGRSGEFLGGFGGLLGGFRGLFRVIKRLWSSSINRILIKMNETCFRF
jgi:hypothetical protein